MSADAKNKERTAHKDQNEHYLPSQTKCCHLADFISNEALHTINYSGLFSRNGIQKYIIRIMTTIMLQHNFQFQKHWNKYAEAYQNICLSISISGYFCGV